MLTELNENLLGKWDDIFPGKRRPAKISHLGIPGSVQGETTTLMCFADRDSRPFAVVKVHRRRNSMEKAHRERDILLRLSGLPVDCVETVPRLIFCDQIGGMWAIGQTVLNGRPMEAPMTGGGMPDLTDAELNMRKTSEWLLEYGCKTREQGPCVFEEFKANWSKKLSDFCSIYEPRGDEDILLQRIADGLEMFRTSTDQIITRHGDFCRQNILVSGARRDWRMGVVDWSFVQRFSPRLHDLYFFLSTYFLQERKHHGLAGFAMAFEDTFVNENGYSRLVRKIVSDHCRRASISQPMARLQFRMFLVDQALFDHELSVKCSRNGGLPRFTVYLASLSSKGFDEALKEGIYIHYFRIFASKPDQFLKSWELKQ